MSPRRLLSAICLCAGLAAAVSAAKTADDYVHGGAARYIQGRLQEASVEVEEGLRAFPGDARLKALAAQLKAMKDQQKKDQGGGEGQGGQGSPEKKDQRDSSANNGKNGTQDQDKKNQDQGKDKDQGKDREKQGGGQDKPKDQDSSGAGEPPQAEPGKQGDSAGQGAAPVPPGQMSKEEAERLLNSYQDDEKREQKNLRQRYRKQAEVEQDW